MTNFAFQAIASRTLSPSGYGLLVSLLNVTAVMTVPMAAIQAATAQTFLKEHSPAGAKKVTFQVLCFSILIAGGWFALTPLTDLFLNTHGLLAPLLVALWIVASGMTSVWQGVLMAANRWIALGLVQILALGLCRLVAGWASAVLHGGVSGMLLATALAPLLAAGALSLVVFANTTRNLSDVRLNLYGLARSVLTLGGVTTLISGDVWLARHYLPGPQSGLLGSAVTAGRIALFLPGTVIVAAFTSMARDEGRSRDAVRSFQKSIALVAALTGVGSLTLVAAAHPTIKLLFGDKYLRAAPLLTIVAISAAEAAVLMAITYYELALSSNWSYLPWLGCAIGAYLVVRLHSSARQIAWVVVVTDGLTLALAITVLATQLAKLSVHQKRSQLHLSSRASVSEMRVEQ